MTSGKWVGKMLLLALYVATQLPPSLEHTIKVQVLMAFSSFHVVP